MSSLFAAIYAMFVAAPGGVHNALYLALNGNLFNTGAPLNTALPLATMSLVNNQTDLFMEKILMQFSIFSNTPGDTEILNAYAALIALYDNCSLANVGNPSNLGMERRHSLLMKEDTVWHYVVEYEIWVERM